MPLDDRRLLLNGLQPPRLSSGSAPTRPHKRQRTEGMNSRFDRMVQTVDVMYGSPRGSRRKRATSSSSATSYDATTTLFGAYSDHHGSRRRRDPVTTKTTQPHTLPDPQDIFSPDAFNDSTASLGLSATELPPWLQGTLSALDSQHPLRLLVPGQAVTRGGSSPSSLGPSSDSFLAPSIEECPFSFSSPADPSDVAIDKLQHLSTVSPRQLHGSREIAFAKQSTDLLALPASLRKHIGYDEGQLRLPDVAFEAPMRPYSTPGPASAHPATQPIPLVRLATTDFSQLLDKQPARALTFQQDFSFSLLPFSEPGQIYISTVPDQKHITGEQDTTDIDEQFASISPSPFLRPPALLSPWTDRPATAPHASDMTTSILLSTSKLGTACPVSPAKSIPVVPFDMTARSTLSVSELQSPRLAVRGYSAESRLTEHADAIEFKWERFDRSNVAPQGSSSPLCAHLESEETFWSQPAMIAINADDPTTAGQPVNASRAIDSSRIPSPAWNPDSARGTSGQHVADLASSFMQSTHPQGDEEDSPFVWILPPRDQPVSTPRRTGKKPLASISDVEMQSYNGGKEEGNQRTSSESNLGSAPTKRARGSPFAPAPGVYISPLQVVQDAPCGDSAIFSPEIDIAIGSETPRVNSPTRHAESSTGRDDIVPHEDNISESPEETLEPFPDVREAIDDDIEDAGDCLESSQESRDTIESWSK